MAPDGRRRQPLDSFGNPPDRWLEFLPSYAELQIGEAEHASEHLAHGVPDLGVDRLPELYEEFLRAPLPSMRPRSSPSSRSHRASTSSARSSLMPAYPSVQHDDLHMYNVYVRDGRLRVLDRGDASIAHPSFSLFETFRFLEQINALHPDDPWFARLLDAYLEPWGSPRALFDLALPVGGFAHAIAWVRQREALPEADRADFDVGFAEILRLAMRRAFGSSGA